MHAIANPTSQLSPVETIAATRAIVYRTRGQQHGPITRLMSPSDLGEHLKPFVFLDLFDADASAFQGFGLHPHSGIATLSWSLQGDMGFEDTSGRQGVLAEGGVEWMQAGGGAWHAGGSGGSERLRGFQLWVALPPALELAPAFSTFLAPDEVAQDGPARVLLGQYGAAHSAIPAPASINYLSVQLKAGERWRYQPPAGHTVAWVALGEGNLRMPEPLRHGDMAVFDTSEAAIDFQAATDCVFVLGSAVPHPHELVLGRYSVHTSREALQQGQAGIQQIGQRLRSEGRFN
ncbi:MAG: pirin family protein [Rhodoferax sp.]|uniref:pirin family protein n=1 Tax=Rhodoferax sp. TaxID=50421 RepID=UPI0032643C37